MIVASCAYSQQPVQKKVSDFQWLSGLWNFEQGERTCEEYWRPLINNRLEGKSTAKKKGKITMQERMVIEQDSAGAVFYRVFSGGSRQVSFKLVQFDQSTVVFENRKNDFPQRIVYERISEDSLRATVDGTVKGKMQSILFPFKRVIVNAD